MQIIIIIIIILTKEKKHMGNVRPFKERGRVKEKEKLV